MDALVLQRPGWEQQFVSGTDLHLFSLVVESARRQLALNELTGPLAVSPVPPSSARTRLSSPAQATRIRLKFVRYLPTLSMSCRAARVTAVTVIALAAAYSAGFPASTISSAALGGSPSKRRAELALTPPAGVWASSLEGLSDKIWSRLGQIGSAPVVFLQQSVLRFGLNQVAARVLAFISSAARDQLDLAEHVEALASLDHPGLLFSVSETVRRLWQCESDCFMNGGEFSKDVVMISAREPHGISPWALLVRSSKVWGWMLKGKDLGLASRDGRPNVRTKARPAQVDGNAHEGLVWFSFCLSSRYPPGFCCSVWCQEVLPSLTSCRRVPSLAALVGSGCRPSCRDACGLLGRWCCSRCSGCSLLFRPLFPCCCCCCLVLCCPSGFLFCFLPSSSWCKAIAR